MDMFCWDVVLVVVIQFWVWFHNNNRSSVYVPDPEMIDEEIIVDLQGIGI